MHTFFYFVFSLSLDMSATKPSSCPSFPPQKREKLEDDCCRITWETIPGTNNNKFFFFWTLLSDSVSSSPPL